MSGGAWVEGRERFVRQQRGRSDFGDLAGVDRVPRAALRVTQLEAAQSVYGLDEGDVLVGVAAVEGLFVAGSS
jgi:hypothetical protein